MTDFIDLPDITEQLRRVTARPDLWPKILSDIAGLLAGRLCTLALSGLVAATSSGEIPSSAEPWLAVLAALPAGAVTTMRRTKRDRAEAEILVGSAGPGIGVMIEAAPGAQFGADAAAKLQVLLPPLASAASASRILSSDAIALLNQMAFGILVLDADGTVRIANNRAIGLLAAAGLGFENGTLRGRTPASSQLLLDHIRLAANGACYATGLPSAGAYAALQFAFVPLRPGRATAMLTAPSADAATNPLPLQALLGLTRAQARLTALLADGFSLREAALRLGITHGSAMTQLKNVYARTGVGSQSALVRLVLTGPAAFIASTAVTAMTDTQQ